ncbi:MAG: molybdopterin-dependent oxidoreductase [Proteobacteria bacterium]|nr:molybdopterin-dependent oxidoreductase [Pseudomonadota bacterium]MBU1452417.1 molybdopterin-dependent oxidoreductase [Pseudomonadota bacterium]MBU2467684.1 molybdopterin-dependent oxidoreductase [Pseudomonadota bacterium]MBU2518236.1 molybdopterin-dependent oxidoreductase [Pseudomonadota bacterium]
MKPRRAFLSLGLQAVAGLCLAMTWPRRLWAAGKRRVLGGHVKATDLAHLNPRDIDNRNLAVTPLEQFGTMGQSDLVVDLDKWRLVVDGAVRRPLSLDLKQLEARPVLERTVLLICTGVFSFNARWKGLSLGKLLQEAEPLKGANRVVIKGVGGAEAKIERFSLGEVMGDEVFLAYEVNGRPLPRKHGFPLRVVAGAHFGDDWVKYVTRVSLLGAGEKG